MPETLGTDYDDIRAEMGFHFGWGPTTDWDTETVANADRFIKMGLNRFFFQAVPVGTRKAYDWSFLRKTWLLSTIADTWQYDLPRDFGSIDGTHIPFADATVGYTPIPIINDAFVLEKRSKWPAETGVPNWGAIRYKPTAGEEQRAELLIFPAADAAYTLKLRFSVLPWMLGAQLLNPHGGAAHARTIKYAILAEAERRANDKPGFEADYQAALIASISYDVRNIGTNLGANTDESDRAEYTSTMGYVTVNGQLYEG